MKLGFVIVIVAALLLGLGAAGWAQQNHRTYDPSPDWGGARKVFYEGWGFGPPAGTPSMADSKPYRIEDPYIPTAVPYGRGWTSIGVNKEAWVCAGLNNQTNPQPKPGYYHLSGTNGYIHESNDWTNTDADGGSRPFAGPTVPYATGTYLDTTPQPYYNQAVWLDASDIGTVENGPRSQILLKHDVPTLTDQRKLRADVLYWFLKSATQELGYGIRIYFDRVGGGEVTVDFALHFYKSSAGYSHVSTFGWRIQGVTEHPEWANWTDTPAQMHTIADQHTFKQVAIDCGQILPGGLVFMTRGNSDNFYNMEPESANMIAAFVPNFAQYVTGATAIAVGQVDETVGNQDVGERLWMDDIFISEGITTPLTTILQAKTTAQTKPVQLIDAVVTGAFYTDGPNGPVPAAFSVQDPNVPVGIRVVSSKQVNIGDKVDIVGQNGLVAGERVIIAPIVAVKSNNNQTPKPLAMSNKASGGGAFGYQGAVVDNVPAVPPTPANGLNNIGLLMKITGRLTTINDTGTFGGYFYVDDGSSLNDGTLPGTLGIRCRPQADPDNGYYPAYISPFDIGRYVQVTGVMGCQDVDSGTPVVLARYFWTTSMEFVDEP